MNHMRLAGIDLGIATAHTVRVPDGEGTVPTRGRAGWAVIDPDRNAADQARFVMVAP